jgi:hypothetical protein
MTGSAGHGQVEEEEVGSSDPVIAGVRQGMENVKQLVKDIIPTCDTGKPVVAH